MAIEVTVRIEDWLRWRTPLLSSASSVADLAVTDETGRHPMPHSAYGKWKINSLGTRGPEPEPERSEARVLVLGASETFGLYEAPDHEYPRQLADSLHASGCEVDVLNAGFVGMSLPTVEQDLRLRLARLNPDVVVYYPTPPQYLDEALPRRFPIDASPPMTKARAWWYPRFAARARTQLKQMLPAAIADWIRARDIRQARASHDDQWVFDAVPSDRLQAFEMDLRVLVGTIHAVGSKAVLVTHVHRFLGQDRDERVLRSWERFYPRATGATILAFEEEAAEAVRRVAADSGLALADPWAAFARAESSEVFADFSHFTDLGASLMASELRHAAATAAGCSPKQEP
ncbi:MAG: hypothetical protein H0W15_03565 [Gemmatimonadales bacterium]|nr:hypothetical protein [Gemmatimonadales bacterium]